ncbi:MAG: triose-phosphate isomerase, partial [Gemmatimonadota bacterium]|nr:triose-phosphate isomerase [Gemmatimonadota bacterium]
MQRPVFAANWKMHHGPTAARAFVAAFLARFSPRLDRTVVLFPPALSVHPVVTARADRTDIKVGVQNIHTEEKGAFTGEISAPMSRDAGADFVLVGHSERRHIFGETDAQAARKCAVAFAQGLTPVLCVGETFAQRESGATSDVVLTQLRAGLADLDQSAIRRMAIAYEPVWAIGTGRTATPDDAASVHIVIRDALAGLAGRDAASVP